jgi:hypothetical protein
MLPDITHVKLSQNGQKAKKGPSQLLWPIACLPADNAAESTLFFSQSYHRPDQPSCNLKLQTHPKRQAQHKTEAHTDVITRTALAVQQTLQCSTKTLAVPS